MVNGKLKNSRITLKEMPKMLKVDVGGIAVGAEPFN